MGESGDGGEEEGDGTKVDFSVHYNIVYYWVIVSSKDTIRNG